MTITPKQCRAARVLLDWSQSDLSRAAGIGRAAISRFETGERTPYKSTQAALRAAFEAGGIVFIEDDGIMGPGLRLRESGKK